jgi:hypothetical protein
MGSAEQRFAAPVAAGVPPVSTSRVDPARGWISATNRVDPPARGPKADQTHVREPVTRSYPPAGGSCIEAEVALAVRLGEG